MAEVRLTMCGIAGILNVNRQPVSRVELERMTTALAHRGPDGEGYFEDRYVGLGHRRLAILDLTPAGNQPMITPDGRYAIVYNGEVYNYRELRAELEKTGHAFRSRTDTEVVLHAFAAWGIDAVDRFNGMFAFAVWDRRDETLWLVRDRYGIKPLYYRMKDGVLLFGSEVKALLAHSSCRAEMDRHGLIEYFSFQNFFTDRTLFQDIALLAPGTWMSFSAGRRVLAESRRYWDYQFREEEGTDARDYEEELSRLMAQAVDRQLVSDVDVGTYLSGGIDSGTITALAAQRLPNIRSFTAGFDLHSVSGLELAFDERTKAELMSSLFATTHYEMVLKAGDMERVLPAMARHLEEPRVGQSYPNYYAAELAGKFVKVILSGTGGDELFGGYPWRYYRAVVNSSFDEYVDKYFASWQRLIPDSVAREVFAPLGAVRDEVDPREIFRRVFHDHADTLSRPEDYINHSLTFEVRTFLHGLLVMEDKLSMAHGLETRVPFLDNDLVDFAMKLPVRMKLGNLAEVVRLNENIPGPKTLLYFQKTRDGKLLLRRAAARLLPPEIIEGSKQGFSAPDATWFRDQSIDFVRRRLLDREARIYEYLDRTIIRKLVEDHLDGRENRRLLIWSLLSVEQFCETYLD